MAKIKTIDPIEKLSGKLGKDSDYYGYTNTTSGKQSVRKIGNKRGAERSEAQKKSSNTFGGKSKAVSEWFAVNKPNPDQPLGTPEYLETMRQYHAQHEYGHPNHFVRHKLFGEKTKKAQGLIQLDVHTHSIVSGHAYSTISEMVKEAQMKGLSVLGITEHAPNLPGAPGPIYFWNLHVVPRQWGDLRLLLGAELNILDTKGTLDRDENYYDKLDIRIAGIHKLCWQGGTVEENTDGMIAAIRNPYTDIISHPGDGTADLLFEPIVLAAKETGTLLEINNSSLKPCRGKTEKAVPNNLEILRLCKQYEVPVILGSDAHMHFDIANYDNIYPLLRETEFPEALIMNNKAEEFLEWLDQRSKVKSEE